MIPFTQFLRPNGRRKEDGIERPAEIEEMAQQIIAKGYRFEAEVLMTGHVHLDCCGPNPSDPNEDIQVTSVVSKNGPEILDKVDELVRTAHERIMEKT
jgi:hypothetical protein